MDAADQEVILWDRKIPEDILKEIATPQEVPAERTVWIRPTGCLRNTLVTFQLN